MESCLLMLLVVTALADPVQLPAQSTALAIIAVEL